MKKVFILISVLTVLGLTFNSCKKGEDDPFISLRSRNNRIIGKWKLKEYTYEKKYSYTRTVSNNINSDFSYNTIDSTITKEISNDTLIEYVNFYDIYTTKYTHYNQDSYIFIPVDGIYRETIENTIKYKYEVSIEIKKDYTWIANFKKTKYFAHYKYSNYGIENSDTIFNFNDDDLIDRDVSELTWTETGYWNWEGSRKSKLIINAGPIKGHLKRLSNKEIIIEEINNSNNSSVYYQYDNYMTYSDVNNPDNREEGVGTSKVNYNANIKTYYKWVAE